MRAWPQRSRSLAQRPVERALQLLDAGADAGAVDLDAGACAERRQRTAQKRALAEEFWQTLHAARPEARLHTPADGLPGLLSVGLPGRSGQRLTYQLDVAGVSVSPGAACDNRGVQEPSHVLMALGGTAAEDALSTLRFSFGSANRPGDGKEAAERLIKILEQQ